MTHTTTDTKRERDTEMDRIQALCHYIETHAEEALSLAQLAALAGCSSTYLQRRFKAVLGVSPRQYQEACRLTTFKQALKSGQSVTEALYQAGFASSSRLYEKLDTRLGMTPTQYRQGGQGLNLSYASCDTEWGLLMLAASDRGLCFIQFAPSEKEALQALQQEFPQAVLTTMPAENEMPSDFIRWMEALKAHLRGNIPHLDLPLDIQGTAFQKTVWQYLQQIPYGTVKSYTEVAEALGNPKAARAVARACAINKLALAIPCHRVLRGTGHLGGYRWGLPLKQHLLDQERERLEPSQDR